MDSSGSQCVVRSVPTRGWEMLCFPKKIISFNKLVYDLVGSCNELFFRISSCLHHSWLFLRDSFMDHPSTIVYISKTNNLPLYELTVVVVVDVVTSAGKVLCTPEDRGRVDIETPSRETTDPPFSGSSTWERRPCGVYARALQMISTSGSLVSSSRSPLQTPLPSPSKGGSDGHEKSVFLALISTAGIYENAPLFFLIQLRCRMTTLKPPLCGSSLNAAETHQSS